MSASSSLRMCSLLKPVYDFFRFFFLPPSSSDPPRLDFFPVARFLVVAVVPPFRVDRPLACASNSP